MKLCSETWGIPMTETFNNPGQAAASAAEAFRPGTSEEEAGETWAFQHEVSKKAWRFNII